MERDLNDYRFFFEAFFFATFFVAFFATFFVAFFAAFFFAAIKIFLFLIIICDDRPLYCDWTRYHHMYIYYLAHNTHMQYFFYIKCG